MRTQLVSRPSWLPPLALCSPRLTPVARLLRSVERRAMLMFDGHDYRLRRHASDLAFRVKKHQSVLLRKLGDTDMRLQHNKVQNLRIVIEQLDRVVLRPGQTFSFCLLVGKPTRARGFVEGMELSAGRAQPGVGGGICQASNLIFWLALHSPLEVIERHHHSFDPFPDQNRILPFASGATVMYPYRDLRLRNNTEHRFQLRMWLDKKCLNADLRVDKRLPLSYSVFERNHRFYEEDGRVYRDNQLWRRVIDKGNGRDLCHEFLFANHAEVRYRPNSLKLERASPKCTEALGPSRCGSSRTEKMAKSRKIRSSLPGPWPG